MQTAIGSSVTIAVPMIPATVVDYGTAGTLSRLYKNTGAGVVNVGLGTLLGDAVIPLAAGESVTIDGYTGPVVFTSPVLGNTVAKGSIG